MIFTQEQFNKISPFYLDDLNINSNDQSFMFKVFNLLPDYLQCEVIEWGFSESLTREKIFIYLIKKIYNITIDDYYKNKMYKNDVLSNTIVLTKLMIK